MRPRVGLLAVGLSLLADGAAAQSLAGFSIGEDFASSAKPEGTQVAEDKVGDETATKWTLANGNTLSATRDGKTGRIVYIELSWNGDATGVDTGVHGLRFGVDSIIDTRERFGAGFAFKDRASLATSDGFAFLDAYEIKDSNAVAVIATLLKTADVPQDGDLAKGASATRLNSIILAEGNYLAKIWGDDVVIRPGNMEIGWPK